MEIKYEAVFGDQALFEGSELSIDIIRYNRKIGLYFKDSLNNLSGSLLEQPIVAMRRIIRTPVWTKGDQKAGKLPEVGAKVDSGKVVFVNSFNVVTELESGAVIVSSPKTFLNTFNPIETTEEKAKRLREEWYERATFMNTYEIYDALLSGDLPVPGKGER